MTPKRTTRHLSKGPCTKDNFYIRMIQHVHFKNAIQLSESEIREDTNDGSLQIQTIFPQ